MFCRFCGCEVPEKSVFCLSCGGKIDRPDSPEGGIADETAKPIVTPDTKREPPLSDTPTNAQVDGNMNANKIRSDSKSEIERSPQALGTTSDKRVIGILGIITAIIFVIVSFVEYSFFGFDLYKNAYSVPIISLCIFLLFYSPLWVVVFLIYYFTKKKAGVSFVLYMKKMFFYALFNATSSAAFFYSVEGPSVNEDPTNILLFMKMFIPLAFFLYVLFVLMKKRNINADGAKSVQKEFSLAKSVLLFSISIIIIVAITRWAS